MLVLDFAFWGWRSLSDLHATSRSSGIPWEMLPQEMGCGSGMSCWRRLRDWQEAGIWQPIHFVLLDWLARYGQIDWSRAVVDGSSVRAVFGGFKQALILRPSEARQQASSDLRRTRNSAGYSAHRGQPKRLTASARTG